jgi:hypothetical protein
MAIKKLWFSLKELSEIWQCTINDILYLGITGQLPISFDWAALRKETKGASFDFSEIYDVSYCVQAEQVREFTTRILLPEYDKTPLLRLAQLDVDSIAIIKKSDVVPVYKAFISPYEYFNVYIDDAVEDHQYPLISIDDLVVTSEHVDQYNDDQKTTSSAPQSKTIRAVESDEKLIGLLTLALIDKTTGNRLSHGDNTNIQQVANLLVQYRPEGISQSGIKHETIRKKLSKSLRMLDPQNN